MKVQLRYVRAAAEANSQPYFDATLGAEPGVRRMLSSFEDLEEFWRRDVYAKAKAAEALVKTGK